MNGVATLKSKAARNGRGRRESPGRAEELMSAALDLFARGDYATVTIKDIAAATGVNAALIYYYFESKEDLFRAAIEHAVDGALANYRRLCERHDDPVDLIGDWLRVHVDLTGPIRNLVKIMLDYTSTPHRSTAGERPAKRFYDEERDILSAIIRQGVTRGIFRHPDPGRAAVFISTHLDGVMIGSLIREDFDVGAAIVEFEQVLWAYLGRDQDAGRDQA